MTINNSKVGRSTSLVAGALLLAVSSVPQADALSFSALPSFPTLPSLSYPTNMTLCAKRLAWTLAIISVMRVVTKKPVLPSDPSLQLPHDASIWLRIFHAYDNLMVGQRGEAATLIEDAEGKVIFEPKTYPSGLVGQMVHHKADIACVFGLPLAVELTWKQLHATLELTGCKAMAAYLPWTT